MDILRKWKYIISVLSVTLLAALFWTTSVRADDTLCTGSLGAIYVDNLIVPDNASCTLNGTIVGGNLFVRTNATLHAYDVQVSNDIQANSAARVNVYPGSSVGGNLQIVKSGAAEIQSADIDNNLYINENHQPVNAANNTVGGNLQAFKNTGGVSINGNHIIGNLQCRDNNPPPTGAGNIVGGNMEDQCANFGGIPTPAPTNTQPPPTSTPTPTNTPPAPTSTSTPTNMPPAPTLTPTRTSTPMVDTSAPTVSWMLPVLAQQRFDVRDGDQVLLEATARDNKSIQEVVFLRWDAVNLAYVTIHTVNQSPYRTTINASALNPGWNQVFVMALDASGNQSDYPYIWLYKLVDGKMSAPLFLPVIGR